FAICLALVVCLVGLTAAEPRQQISPDAGALAQSNNAFAFDLYAQLSHEDGNLFFSPYSISNALAMTSAGARGKTANDMVKTLKFPFAGDRLHPAFATLIKELDRHGQERKYQL